MLRKRQPVVFGKGLTPVRKNWQPLLRSSEQSFLTDNQLSAFVDPKRPGCERTHFYPLPFPHKFTGGKWNFTELSNHDSLRSTGPCLDLTPDKTELVFLPHLIEKKMTSGAARIVERSTISGNILLIEFDIKGLDRVALDFSLPHFDAKAETIPGGVVASVRGEAFAALASAGAAKLSFETKETPFACRADLTLSRGRKLCVALSCGYDRDSAVRAARAAARDPRKVFAAAKRTWDDYFTKIVPHFACSDKRIERLYYYQAYATRANLYDIPYEPFTHPYTCPWKTGAVWQWTWNTPMDSICERWLNDKAIGAAGILLEGDNGGALNLGSYLHPTIKHTQLRAHNEAAQVVGGYLKGLPETYDLPVLTTMAHTTPNGLLGAWELYLCSGDRDFLRQALDVMTEAESQFARHELPSGLCTTNFVDEFDYSLRLKPFIQAFRKGDPEMMLKLDTPFIAIDYNCYLHALRERIVQAAAELAKTATGTSAASKDVPVPAFAELRAKNDRLKAAINEYLWDERDGFYYDADPRDMKRSGVKCIGGIAAPLYSGIATPEHATRIIAHLTDPHEFGTPYPCPSISMDTPDVDPSLLAYGGDSLITSGIWFTVEGLIRYGYTDLAAQYIIKAIELLMKDGPSSAYSYHCITGAPNQAKHTLADQGLIVTDLICRYLVGLCPGSGGTLTLNPLALPQSGVKEFVFGPYRYCRKTVTARYDRKHGYRVTISPR